MSLRKFDAVQSFSRSRPVTGNDLDLLPLSVSPSLARSCCTPCTVVTVRPVLCSQALNEETMSADGLPIKSNLYNIARHHKTPSGVAWVQREASTNEQMENWERAKLYNEEIENLCQEKTSRLIEFRQEVKQRVRKMGEEKQRAVLAKTYRDVEMERKVARRTACLAQDSIPNASNVILRGREDLMVKTQSLSLAATADEKQSEIHSQKVKKLHQSIEHEKRRKQNARQKLGSRQLVNTDEAELPGGFWRDTSAVELPAPRDQEAADVDTDDAEGDVHLAGLTIHAKDMNLPNAALSDEQNPSLGVIGDLAAGSAKKVGYALSGAEKEEVRKQEVKQRALLRRLYMDIEREQIKEYRKMKSHYDRIAKIKGEKEEERRRQELKASLSCLPQSPQQAASSGARSASVERDRRLQRQIETQRYIKALRSLLREKIDRLGVQVPALCSCGDSVWDTHPDHCANNCPFYKNPKGYERAMQTLLASCHIQE